MLLRAHDWIFITNFFRVSIWCDIGASNDEFAPRWGRMLANIRSINDLDLLAQEFAGVLVFSSKLRSSLKWCDLFLFWEKVHSFHVLRLGWPFSLKTCVDFFGHIKTTSCRVKWIYLINFKSLLLPNFIDSCYPSKWRSPWILLAHFCPSLSFCEHLWLRLRWVVVWTRSLRKNDWKHLVLHVLRHFRHYLTVTL